MDKLMKAQRSYNMSQIKSKNTKPEILLFRMLDKAKIRYRKHYNIFGKPDIAFPKQKLAIFIDGEFWHGKDFSNLKNKISPFWVKKIGDNIKRDNKIKRELRANGWHVLRIWDKKVNKHPERVMKKIIMFLDKLNGYLENQK